LCQFNKLFNGKYFGPQLQIRMINRSVGHQRFNRISYGFSSLVKCHFNQLNEQLFITWELLTLVSCATNNSWFNFWRRIKHVHLPWNNTQYYKKPGLAHWLYHGLENHVFMPPFQSFPFERFTYLFLHYYYSQTVSIYM